MKTKPEIMSTSGGNPIADNRNSGSAGPLLMQDVQRPRASAVESEFLATRS